MPKGRPSQYLHHGNPPVEPEGGWVTESAQVTNPPYAFLSGALIARTIDPYGSPPDIYSNNSQLHCIEPKRFLRFFRKTVKQVLGINLEEEEPSASTKRSSKQSYASSNLSSGASTITIPSNISTATGTTAPSKAFTMNYSDIDGDESHFSSPPPGSGIVTASDGTILHADPLPPESQSTGKHSQVFPEYSIIDHPGGKKAHIKFSPLQDINVGKIQYTASTKDRRVGLVSWPKGGSADPKAVRRALTSGRHVISYPQDGTLHGESLQLDQADAVVAGFTEDARSRHVSDGNNGMNVLAVKFDKPVKPKLVSIQATNNTVIPPKCLLSPNPNEAMPSKEKVNLVLLGVEYESNDKDERNFTSFDEDLPHTGAAAGKPHYHHRHRDHVGSPDDRHRNRDFYHSHEDSESYGERNHSNNRRGSTGSRVHPVNSPRGRDYHYQDSRPSLPTDGRGRSLDSPRGRDYHYQDSRPSFPTDGRGRSLDSPRGRDYHYQDSRPSLPTDGRVHSVNSPPRGRDCHYQDSRPSLPTDGRVHSVNSPTRGRDYHYQDSRPSLPTGGGHRTPPYEEHDNHRQHRGGGSGRNSVHSRGNGVTPGGSSRGGSTPQISSTRRNQGGSSAGLTPQISNTRRTGLDVQDYSDASSSQILYQGDAHAVNSEDFSYDDSNFTGLGGSGSGEGEGEVTESALFADSSPMRTSNALERRRAPVNNAAGLVDLLCDQLNELGRERQGDSAAEERSLHPLCYIGPEMEGSSRRQESARSGSGRRTGTVVPASSYYSQESQPRGGGSGSSRNSGAGGSNSGVPAVIEASTGGQDVQDDLTIASRATAPEIGNNRTQEFGNVGNRVNDDDANTYAGAGHQGGRVLTRGQRARLRDQNLN